MKKVIYLLLIGALLVAMLTGCTPKLDEYDHTVTGLLPGEDCHRKLLLQDDIQIKFFFRTDYAPDCVLSEGEMLPVNREPDGRFSVTFPGFNVSELDKPIDFDFGHIHVETSGLAYIRDCLAVEDNEAVRDVMKSLYKSFLKTNKGGQK